MNFSLSGLAADYQSLKKIEKEFVLATIVETEGSTYRKPGARMLLTRNNNCIGLLGGDELHKAIIQETGKIFKTHEPAVVDFFSRDTKESFLEQELEPGARVSVMLEYITTDNPSNTMEVLALGLQQANPSVLITVSESGINECPAGANILISGEEIIYSELEQRFKEAVADIVVNITEAGKSSLGSCIYGDGSFTAFYDIIEQPLRLLIAGAGPDAVPVLQIAVQLGWIVTITDPRDACANSEHFSSANRVLNIEPGKLPEAIDIDAVDAVVIMTHRFDLDEQYLRILMGNTKLRYIGLLGTAARRDKLLKILDLNPEITGEQIYGPAGLDIGGKSPDEIALSLIAEIQAVMNRRNGGQLTAILPVLEKEPAINEKDLFAVVLAAGGSRRFGGIKQLLEFRGKSLLKRVIETANSTMDYRVKLVLGIKHNKLQREADGIDLEVVVNNDWENGIASSLRAGISSLPDHCKAALIILCDQPLIDEPHLRQIIDVWLRNNTKIVASSYADTLGVPAIFPREYFDSILKLKGDNGAKSIIEENREEVIAVPIPEAEIDINTQEDVIRLLSE